MLVFGHTGLTLGTAILVSHALDRIRLAQNTPDIREGSSSRFWVKLRRPIELLGNRLSRIAGIGTHIDMRLLLIGSLLPDIIDKPVGQYFFRETFSNGRIFCHTLLFLILITMLGIVVLNLYNKSWFSVLSFGTFTHLVFDQMWRTPQTLFWPLLGIAFGRVDLTDWVGNIFIALFTDPTVYVPELIGLGILMWFMWTLIRRRGLIYFIRYGKTPKLSIQ